MTELVTGAGTRIRLLEQHPAHGPLSQCALALTTVGANTAELGALAVPMIVIVPTQHLEVMQAWDGGLGLLARLPGLRRLIGVLLTLWRLRNNGLMAWPNISAGRAVVPERVGAITPEEIAKEACDWLNAPRAAAGAAPGPPGVAGRTRGGGRIGRRGEGFASPRAQRFLGCAPLWFRRPCPRPIRSNAAPRSGSNP